MKLLYIYIIYARLSLNAKFKHSTETQNTKYRIFLFYTNGFSKYRLILFRASYQYFLRIPFVIYELILSIRDIRSLLYIQENVACIANPDSPKDFPF